MENPAARALAELVATDPNRSKIGRMRELLPSIEAAIAAGVSTKKIVETLCSQSLDVTQQSFYTMLYRLRKEQGITGRRAIAKPAVDPILAAGRPVSKPAAPVAASVSTVAAKAIPAATKEVKNAIPGLENLATKKATYNHDEDFKNVSRDDLI